MVHSNRLLRTLGKRAYHDLTSIPTGNNVAKPVVSHGPPGYSAASGHVVTVFGCTGFLGRYLVSKLARQGTQVIIPYRDEDEKRRLKPMGDLGQIVPMEWDIRNENQIAEAVRHSDIVYNLVGRDYETKNFSFSGVHAKGAQRIAKVSSEVGVPRFVQLSHLNASHNSPSKFYQSRAEGEELVKEIFPSATIVRPSAMYGYEDKLLNSMAYWPFWWNLNQARTKFRPVHVMDVAQALTNLAHMPSIPQSLNLPGPSTLTYEYMLELVQSLTYRESSTFTIPKPIAKTVMGLISKNVWWPVMSPDEIERKYIDDVETPGDWDVVGITPAEVEQHALMYVRRYRNAQNFSRPAVFPGRPAPEATD